jgi:hypothetical protein
MIPENQKLSSTKIKPYYQIGNITRNDSYVVAFVRMEHEAGAKLVGDLLSRKLD